MRALLPPMRSSQSLWNRWVPWDMRPVNLCLIWDGRRRLSVITDDARETSQLFQRVSILIQRYNAVASRDSFVKEDNDVIG